MIVLVVKLNSSVNADVAPGTKPEKAKEAELGACTAPAINCLPVAKTGETAQDVPSHDSVNTSYPGLGVAPPNAIAAV